MRLFVGLFMIAILAPSISSQGEQSESILRRKVLLRSVNSANTTNVLTQVLSDASVPGGIATVGYCGEDVTYMFSSSGPRLEDALRTIVTTNPQYRWTISNGVVNVFPVEGDPALLTTVIPRVEIRKADTIDEATGLLLLLPEIQERMRELNLREGFVRIGISDLTRPGHAPPVREQRYRLRLRNVTLREALNAIARASGKGVWEYRERRCNDNTEFQVQFLVR